MRLCYPSIRTNDLLETVSLDVDPGGEAARKFCRFWAATAFEIYGAIICIWNTILGHTYEMCGNTNEEVCARSYWPRG